MDNIFSESFMLNNIKIYVSENHRFGTDAFLLADFARALPNHKVCDLCTGCGIIPLILCRNRPPKKIYGVEIDPEGAALFQKSVDENQLTGKVFSVCGDLKDIPAGNLSLPTEYFDIVTVNPPYSKNGSGAQSKNPTTAAARHELLCDINDVTAAAARLLKYGGSLKICQLPSRLADVICAMREHGIEPKIVTPVTKKKGDAPWLILVSGKKGAKSGMVIEKELYIYEQDGSYSRKMNDIYEVGSENQ